MNDPVTNRRPNLAQIIEPLFVPVAFFRPLVWPVCTRSPLSHSHSAAVTKG